MPADFELDRPSCIVRTRAWGALTDAELLAHRAAIAALVARGDLDASWAQLVDFTGVTSMDGVTSDGVRRMAERNPWPDDAVRVLVVPTDVTFGLARMYQMFGEPKTDAVHLARTMAEAEAYIDRIRSRLASDPSEVGRE
jgi:hypothetical protein